MKISFSTLGCPDWKWKDIVSTAKDMGFDGIEVRGVGNMLYAPEIPDFADDNLASVKERLERLELSIPCLSTACMLFNEDEKVITEGKAYIDLAVKLNVPYLRLLGDRNPSPETVIDDKKVVDNALKLSDYAKGKNVTLLIETNGVYADSSRMKKLIETINRDNVAVLWDVHHPFRYFNETPETTVKNLGKYIKYVHVKDSVSEDRVIRYRMMGYGDVPVKEAVKQLKDAGYDGFISLEWVKRWYSDLEDAGVVFLQYVSYMRRILR